MRIANLETTNAFTTLDGSQIREVARMEHSITRTPRR